MEPTAVAWGWPLAALLAGLAVGSWIVWRMLRAPQQAAPPAVPFELRDLGGRLEML